MKLFKEYFQKSKAFFYPLLGIEKGARYVPYATYVAWSGKYDLTDIKFICYYKQKSTRQYEVFENEVLFNNKFFHEYQKIKPGHHVYVFDFSGFHQSWSAFIAGKYSEFNEHDKEVILNFFGVNNEVANTIESYLHPEYYHDDYAEELKIAITTLQEVHETCDKPDLAKETFKQALLKSKLIGFKDVYLSI